MEVALLKKTIVERHCRVSGWSCGGDRGVSATLVLVSVVKDSVTHREYSQRLVKTTV